MCKSIFRLSLAMLLVLCIPSLTFAAGSASDFASMAGYMASDRDAKLIPLAQKEGQLVIYYSHPVMSSIAHAFEKKYGIKVTLWRSNREGTMQRILAEHQAGRDQADLLDAAPADQLALAQREMLEPVHSPVQADLMKGAVEPKGVATDWVLDVYTAIYNTNLVKPADLPKSYEDLLKPYWKGKLAVEAYGYPWYGTLASLMGEAKTRALFQKIVATNGITVRKGHTLLANLVAAGEIPMALNVYSWNAAPLKKEGAPLANDFIQPLIAFEGSIGIMRKAPHPYAALLFYDYLLTDGQKIVAEEDYVPTSTKIESPALHYKINFVNNHALLKNHVAWEKMFDEDIVDKAK